MLASATAAPRSTAASAEFPVRPLAADRGHYPVRRTRGGFMNNRALAGAAFDARPGQSLFQFAEPDSGSAIASKPRAEFFGELGPAPSTLAVFAVSAHRPDSGSRAPRSKSMVLSPMEPVAPRTVTVRTGGRRGLVVTQPWNCAHCFTQTAMGAAADASSVPPPAKERKSPPRRQPATNPSRRSSSPPAGRE